ncbi:DNA-3-methyladenine glycosylase I [Hoyosella rhizosphaerae]|uniref:3-methyladenine DNA glycosylase n=1 Tax=Hoyosella rhizosphaerae TaxID=1755582 RepID=A0A916U9N8_9ACTN|nr:DNA-3-methyladenine glycosylase I [Hoyosella rhizosphaerae]MBN4927600.1 DNA-3-methyladenine glycosylase I [Hoyosella rhizosphaerae]GGC63190.1 3-methyladenine DNA glycosylase [Hoyosella rhizosphaerae]
MTDEHDMIVGDDGLLRPPWAARDALMRHYYDTEWGVPVTTERGIYEKLVLEGFQAGLSWATVLRKREAFRDAFDQFHPSAVATYTDSDVEHLLTNTAIIRNRAKIRSAINNARRTLELRADGGLAALIWAHQPSHTPQPRNLRDIPNQSPESQQLSKNLKERGFTFVGPITMFALMESIGIVDTHHVDSHRRGISNLWNKDGSRSVKMLQFPNHER